MTFDPDIQISLVMNCNNFGDPFTFLQAQQAGQIVNCPILWFTTNSYFAFRANQPNEGSVRTARSRSLGLISVIDFEERRDLLSASAVSTFCV